MLDYLHEIRRRLLKSLLVLCVSFTVLFYFSQYLFALFAMPLLEQLSPGQTVVAIGVATPLITPLKLSFYVALMLAIPFLLYQLWAFIAPALYAHERRMMGLMMFPSVLLFYGGMAFAYFVVFPLVFKFFSTALPMGVQFLPDMAHYLDFALQMLIAFGIAFQLPVIVVCLALMGVLTLEQLIAARGYVVVIAFVVGMLLTPPDVLSQILLAVPLCLLYEISLLVIRLLIPKPVNT